MTKPPAEATFQLYRYQILPLSRQDFLPLPGVPNLEELLEQKNRLFAEALTSIERFEHDKGEIIHRLEVADDDFMVLRIGSRKRLQLHRRDFSEEPGEDWPFVYVVINNDPQIQTAAIQSDFKVFRRTRTVAQILEDNLNRVLHRENLGVYFEPQFEKGDFWSTVERYPNRIVQATFDLVSPNMSNISNTLKIDLGALNKSTNTKRTVIDLNSDRDANLTLKPDDPILSGMVDYASKGGGAIKLKVEGLKRSISTKNQVKEVSINAVSIETSDPKLLRTAIESVVDE